MKLARSFLAALVLMVGLLASSTAVRAQDNETAWQEHIEALRQLQYDQE